MSSLTLSITNRALSGQAWTPEGGAITAEELDKIQEQQSNCSTALNALPTPFARFYVVKDAFRRLTNQKEVGLAYQRLVSDTLDVYELLFNMEYHHNHWGKNCHIEIRTWTKQNDLERLNKDFPILGKSVSTYFDEDINEETVYFVVLVKDNKNYLLAASSPYTGFVTPPDLDKNPQTENSLVENPFIGERYHDLQLKRKGEGNGLYFRDIRHFDQRDAAFKNYMYQLMDNQSLDRRMLTLQGYIKSFGEKNPDIKTNSQTKTNPIKTTSGEPLVVNGLEFSADCSLSSINWFNDILIMVPFRLSKTNYQPMIYENDNDARNFDYLLPLSEEALKRIQHDGFEKLNCRCKTTSKLQVEVILTFNGETYKKTYSHTSLHTDGVIYDLKGNYGLDFNIATFPCILSSNKAENDYFKVMLVTKNTAQNDKQNLTLTFYRQEKGGDQLESIETIERDQQARFGIRPAVLRSEQTDNSAESVFYEIFNTEFVAIRLDIKGNDGTYSGMLIPRWDRQHDSSDTQYTFAIDFGTTNTYISCTNNKENNTPEQLVMTKSMVAYLHDYRPSNQRPGAKPIEEAINDGLRDNFVTEFIPPFIDGISYKFPLRTAMCKPKEQQSNFSLFDKCNIAFFYEKSHNLDNQTIVTDIKWDNNHKEERELFIRELLLIVKAAILQKGGQLSKTKLIWFRPLSFPPDTKEDFFNIWKENGRKILHLAEPYDIQCISESEAPYYYFNGKKTIKDIKSVAFVDIGGGSCDFMYFADNTPKVANSVKFGCDVMWGNGSNIYDNAQDNGIFVKAKNMKDNFGLDPKFNDFNREMLNTTAKTKEIINFWISNSQKCKIDEILKDYRPLFLYHFSAIVFYMARMYHSKGLECPKTILFCGNGSYYIDRLTPDKKIIETIATNIFQDIYGNGKVQPAITVELPNERKECTCYGGLEHKGNNKAEEYKFLGIETDNDSLTDLTVKSMKDNFGKLKTEILPVFKDFNDIYLEQLRNLIQNGELKLKSGMYDSIEKTISSDLEASFETNFKNSLERLKLTDQDRYPDSIFFLPLIDKVFDLTKVL